MIKLIDRQMVRGYFKAYIVCLTSLLSLYVVVDLFMNLDDFTHHGAGLAEVGRKIGLYYGYRVVQIFDRLCEAIVLLAAMFTVAWMQRNNEQVPLLSAGMSTRRIVLPVLLCAWFMLSLTVANQELVIPRIAYRLSYERDDPGGQRELSVKGAYDSKTGIHAEGDKAARVLKMIHPFRCTIPESLAGNLIHLTAAQANYVSTGPRQGYWELRNTHPTELGDQAPNLSRDILEVVDTGRYRLHTTDLDFDALTRDSNWFLLASTRRLYDELQKPESTARLSPMAVLFHTRLTRPLLGMLLVFMGLSVILRDQNRNVIISSGMCLVLCGIFFAACYSCKMLGDNDLISPVLAAWLPVLFFGPYAVVLFDAVHT
jgi:lipopolysaccharide export system permease protein